MRFHSKDGVGRDIGRREIAIGMDEKFPWNNARSARRVVN